MIVTGSDISVFNIDDNKIAELGFSDKSKMKRQLMSEHYVLLTFNWIEVANVNRGDYITFRSIRYTIREVTTPTINLTTGGFEHELKFEAIEMFFQDVPFFYLFQDLEEVEWKLMRKAVSFLEIAVACINKYLGFEGDEIFRIGTCMETEMIELSFSSENVFDGMTEVAKKFNGEWYVDYTLKTLNLVKSYEIGEQIELRREVQLKDIKKVNANDEDYCNRLYAFGSTRNIPANYRGVTPGAVVDGIVQKRLRLPVSHGDYIDAVPNLKPIQIIPKVKIFEHIYPKRIGTITELRIDDTKKDENGNPWLVYYFKDSGLNFSSKYILPGETLKVTFEANSWLSGRTLDLEYHDDTEEFEIINDQSTPNYTIPNETIRPRIGDHFVLFNFDISLVGDQYVGEAEQELLQEATEWMESIQEDNATYECPMIPVYAADNDFEMAVGQRVKLVSVLFKSGYKESRVFGYELPLVGYEDSYTIGIKPRYSRLKSIDTTIEANKEIADMQYLEAMKAAQGALRNAKALGYLREALENETTINGGLILTTLIRLGYVVDGVWKETATINGVNRGENDVAYSAGGTLDQAVNAANDPNRIDDIAQFVVTHLGKLIANDVHARGTLETNKDGDRVTMDSERRALILKDKNDNEAGILRLNASENGYSAQLILNSEYGGKFGDSVLSIGAAGLNTRSTTTGHTSYFGQGKLDVASKDSGFHVDCIDSTKALKVILENLPTVTWGLDPGQLWNDNGVLKIHTIE